ncbi:MAG: hypothetical protein AB7G93_05045 [Bdellovibrionales bacterium]
MSANRRKLRNMIVDHAAFLRFSLPFIFLMIASFTVIVLMDLHILRKFSRVTETLPADAVNKMAEIITETTVLGAAGILALGILSYILWFLYSHRILGPSVPILKHIRELCDGRYEGQIQLRRKDEFQEVAKELNRLAEILKKKSQP